VLLTAAAAAAETVMAQFGDERARPPLAEFVSETKLRAVIVGSSKDPNAKITILLVDPEHHRAVLAVKVPTTTQAAAVVAAEGRMLLALSEKATELTGTVPRNVGGIEFHGRAGLVMTAVSGTPMMTSYLRRGHTAQAGRVANDFAAAGRWLATLQRVTAGAPAPMDMDGGVAAQLERRFSDDERVGVDLDRLSSIHARLARNIIPRTAVHGDFWFGNLLLSQRTVTGVVDWEAGQVCGEPVRDLVRFVLMYALFLDRGTKVGRRVAGHPQLRVGSWGAGVDHALDGGGWFAGIVRQFLQSGLTRLGAAPECWRDAALAGVAEVAALTDHPEFARRNLDLFRRLAYADECAAGSTTAAFDRP
jgi:aminoglycoside phosphotransferase (APT) family kinase protein